jgi:hypothetical protein
MPETCSQHVNCVLDHENCSVLYLGLCKTIKGFIIIIISFPCTKQNVNMNLNILNL